MVRVKVRVRFTARVRLRVRVGVGVGVRVSVRVRTMFLSVDPGIELVRVRVRVRVRARARARVSYLMNQPQNVMAYAVIHVQCIHVYHFISHRMSWHMPLYMYHFTVVLDALCLHLWASDLGI